ncbi:MAG: RNA polymerase sigma factor [Candidatus Kapabacteria bacterium]|nr:RNA polymerase sigma factor [Candidatus Kapabacteria bacterium]
MIAASLVEDSEIIKAFVENGADRASSLLVRKYRKFVFATALRFTNSYDDADDISQESFIKAIESIQKFRGESSLKTWLYRITRNLCITQMRKKKFYSLFSSESDESYLEVPMDEASAETKIENEEFERNFVKILAELPEKQRETFALRYFEELSYDEISKMVGVSVGGLKANYFQAVQKLSKRLKME